MPHDQMHAVTTILVVDDTPDNLALLSVLLASDHRVQLANSGERALHLATRNPLPDLILLDVKMPGMDGFEVLKRLKEAPASRDIPVILVTSLTDPADQAVGFALGASDYVTRPIHGALLLARIKTQLDVRRRLRIERDRVESDAAVTLTAILAATNDGFWTIDFDGHVTGVSDAYCRMMGRTRASMIGAHIVQFTELQYSRESIAAEIQRLVHGGGQQRFERNHRHADGSLVPVEFSLMHLPDRQEIAVFIRNISDRKRLQADVQRQAETSAATATKLSTILQSMGEGFWTLDMRGYVTSANDAYCDMVGYARDEIVGKHVRDFSMATVDVETHLRQIADEGLHARFERVHRHRDGHLVHLNVTATYLPAYQEIIVFLKNVSERVAHEETARAAFLERQTQARRFDAMSMASLDGFLIVGADGAIQEANTALTEMVGWDHDDLMGRHITTLTVLETPESARAWKDAILQNSRVHVETKFGRRDGSLVDVDVSLWLDPHDTSFLVFVRDITAAKHAESERLAAAAKLTAVLSTTRDGFWTMDMQGNLKMVNQVACDMLGYPAEMLVGMNLADLDTARMTPAQMQASFQRTIEAGGHRAFETTHRRRDGGEIAVDVSVMYLPQYDEMVAFVRDITERKRREEAVRQAAFFDELTALPNRRMLIEAHRKIVAATVRRGGHGALMFLDMDSFKTLNDTHGHDRGDDMLREVARRLLQCVRDGDTVARLGGDEFAVLLVDLHTDSDEAGAQANTVAERVRVSLCQPYRLGDITHASGCSIGVCLFQGERDGLDTLLTCADSAMYRAKQSGRNAIRFFDADMQAVLAERASRASELREAVVAEQFTLHYQLQVDPHGRPRGAEALVRWVHPTQGLVAPGHVIELAEETGLIVALGDWVLRTACEQLRRWQDRDITREIPLAVNVSARQFGHPGFEARVRGILEASGAPAHLLKLELTETTALKNVEQSIARMSALKELGVKFSMDDFGAGYSSLTYLKQLPFDQLKIDQSFVRGLPEESVGTAIVQSILTMGQALQMEVVAEGIETHAELDALRSRGCTLFQGYLFSKPLPLADFEGLLRP